MMLMVGVMMVVKIGILIKTMLIINISSNYNDNNNLNLNLLQHCCHHCVLLLKYIGRFNIH
jgi:hypothetical protein